jgi:CubicO group peptidase (beta-lactamase class C family)
MTEVQEAAIRARFEENFSARGELGASVSIWQHGREVISLAKGWRDRQQSAPWDAQTLVLVWSITKGLAAACVLHALAADGLGIETRVADLWPEFAANGKRAITLGQVLSHQAGLAIIADPGVAIVDHEAAARALAAQAPVHPGGGSRHGYHPRTFGVLVEEILRRLRPGQTLGGYWREQLAEPLGLDLWIGLPPELHPRVATMFPARSTGARPLDALYDALADESSFTRRAFGSLRGLHSVTSMNTPEARSASLPSLSGIGTARSLGKFYAMLANGGSLEGRAYFPEHAIRWMSTPLVQGPDAVLCMETAFSAGFMQDPVGADGRKLRTAFGPSLSAFGQPGAGGGHTFADPENNIAFAYVMNQMELGVLPNEKSLSLVAALYG